MSLPSIGSCFNATSTLQDRYRSLLSRKTCAGVSRSQPLGVQAGMAGTVLPGLLTVGLPLATVNAVAEVPALGLLRRWGVGATAVVRHGAPAHLEQLQHQVMVARRAAGLELVAAAAAAVAWRPPATSFAQPSRPRRVRGLSPPRCRRSSPACRSQSACVRWHGRSLRCSRSWTPTA